MSWYFVPEHKWLRRELIVRQMHSVNDEPIEESSIPELSTSPGVTHRIRPEGSKLVD